MNKLSAITFAIIATFAASSAFAYGDNDFWWCKDNQCTEKTRFSSSHACEKYRKENGGWCRKAD